MLNVVVLAAGMGKRMRSDLPKVLHTLAGKPMLEHVLQTASRLEPAQTVVVVGHQAGQVKAATQSYPGLRFAEQIPQLGTGHAVQQAAPLLSTGTGSISLILYGDVPLVQQSTLQSLLALAENGLALLTENLENPAGYGRILRNNRGQISGIVEDKDATSQQRAITEVNTGILAAPTSLLVSWLSRLNNNNAQKEYYLTDVVAMAAAEEVPIDSVQPQAGWETLGVNSRKQQAQLERIWQGVQAENLMQAGVGLADPGRLDIRGSLHCGHDVFIDVNCVFEGEVTLEDGVYVGPNCVIRNAHIESESCIQAFTHIDGAQIGKQAGVGPFSRLRPGTQLGEGSHVGNFVEIKNSRFGAQSKAGHLAYLGDALIGERVNIGAGTITCNYDGVNKHQTIIEDDAFIGSDTQLVAPVRVQQGATIAAGTTLTHDAPAQQLTLSLKHQESRPSWKRPVKKS